MSNLKKTRQTYQQIASVYAQAHQQRDQMADQLARFASLVKPGGLVFDVGCGPGLDTVVLQQHGLTAVGLDYTWEMMQTGRNEYGIVVPFVQADMRHLPLRGNLDGLWVCASLLHLERADVLPTVRHFHRLLKPDGILYLSVKLGHGEKWVSSSYGLPHPRYFTFWQPKALDHLLETAAFHIIDGWQEPGKQGHWLVRYARKQEAVK